MILAKKMKTVNLKTYFHQMRKLNQRIFNKQQMTSLLPLQTHFKNQETNRMQQIVEMMKLMMVIVMKILFYHVKLTGIQWIQRKMMIILMTFWIMKTWMKLLWRSVLIMNVQNWVRYCSNFISLASIILYHLEIIALILLHFTILRVILMQM